MPQATEIIPSAHPLDPPEGTDVQRAIEVSQLMRGSNEVIIRHAGQNYRLRITRANKLLLIK